MDGYSSRWWNWKPPAGFRFSATDAGMIVVCTAVTWGLWPTVGKIALTFPVVLGHFFLFCNVFRIPRFLELSWGGIFIINVGFWFTIDRFDWIPILWSQLLPTMIVIFLAIMKTDYHGIGYLLVPWARKSENVDKNMKKEMTLESDG
jgi:hypothetical protein